MSVKQKSWLELEKVRNGDDGPILEIYQRYRPEFINWASHHYQLNHEDAVDIFQETVTQLYRNIAGGKLLELTSTLKTYLFAIGKNLIRDKLKKRDPLRKSSDLEGLGHSSEPEVTDHLYSQERAALVRRIIERVQEPCHSLLIMFYYYNFSMKQIAQKMDYKNEQVAKTQKLRCLNSLKEKVRKKFKQEDLL